MPWKKDDNGNFVEKDGNPVFVYADGKESGLDAEHVTQKIKELSEEAKNRRLELREAQDKLKNYENIDPEQARKALETVANLDAKKMIDAGEAEKVKAEAIKAMQTKIDERETKIKEQEALLHSEMIGGRFSRSKYISDKMSQHPDVVQSIFGGAFKIEDGAVVAYYPNGNKVFSLERPGENANFDEALEALVSAYPHKDSLLKGPGSGTGANAGGTGGGALKKANLTSVQKIAAGLKAKGFGG